MSDFVFYFTEIIKWGFTINLPVLIIGYLLKKEWRFFLKQWRLSMYVIIFVWCIIALVNTTIVFLDRLKLIQENAQQLNYDGYQFVYTPHYWLHFALLLVLLLALIILFLFKRIRSSFSWGLLAFVTLNYDSIVNLKYFLDDYKWPVTYGGKTGQQPPGEYFSNNIPTYMLYIILFTLTVFCVYFLTYHRRRPNPAN